MGFSYRSLHTEDGSSGQGMANDPPRPAVGAIAGQAHPGTAKAAPPGIPGPLGTQPEVHTAAGTRTAGHPAGESVFYSLDELEPEPGTKEAPVTLRGDDATGGAKEKNPAPSPKPSASDAHAAEIRLRAVFGSGGSFDDLDRIASLTAKLPGVRSCILQTPNRAVLASSEPDTLHPIEAPPSLPPLAPLQQACTLLGIGEVEGILLRSPSEPASYFSVAGVSLMARHSSENLEPGLWEKLMLITQASAELVHAEK